jgi:signal transduction histidine kinase
MRDLLNDLLGFLRVGHIENSAEVISFENLAHEAIEIVDGNIKKRGVALNLQSGLPAVYGDHQRLVEVLQNLIDNAVKFMGDQENPQVEIGQFGERDGKPAFFVKDNGIGIAPKYLEQVFGLFNKLNPEIEGTGIGLALVKRIVEQNGGEVWVESELKKGSTFYFTIPRG